MIGYLDRAPWELAPRERRVVVALRNWAGDLRAGRCPVGRLTKSFGETGSGRAALSAHALFHWLAAHAGRSIDLGCPCCGQVSDDEALILAAVFSSDEAASRAGMSALVCAEAVDHAARMARSFGACLAPVGGA